MGLLQAAKARAKAKALPCTITLAWIEERLTKGVCEATGVPLQLGASKATLFSASIDQVRPGQGYTPENARVVSHGWNQLKWTAEDGDVYEYMAAVIQAQPGPLLVNLKRHQ